MFMSGLYKSNLPRNSSREGDTFFLYFRIFALVKPDAISKAGEVIEFLEKNNFKLANLKMGLMSHAAVCAFYAQSPDDDPLPQ